jgi:putative endonuclease
MYYVYVIKSQKNSKLYIGFTNDLKRRLIEHNSGKSKYTKHFIPWVLVYYEAYVSSGDAKERERQFKRYGKAWGQLKPRIKYSIFES